MKVNISKTNIKLAYKGPFYIDILSDLGSYLRQMYRYKPLTCNRLYKIFFELTQNVAKYSAESSLIYEHYKYSGVGSFYVEENDHEIKVSTTNVIKNEDGPILEQYCNEINRMNKDELRKFRSEKRKPHPEAKDTGAYIGIIQIGIITQNNIECSVERLSDNLSVFTICAKVNKE